jgi:mannose-6-phosphate isomerase
VHRLVNPVMGYAWGSRTAIAELQGRPRPGPGTVPEPEAELWLGAHPKAPSRIGEQSLADLVAADPKRVLGARVAERFRGELPFLLKVLAADQPLSLQVHPSFEQARGGYAREEALGIDVAAAERNYRDPHPKPELVCALSPFTALSGFRERNDAVAILRAFDLDGAATQLATAASFHEGLRHLIGSWLRLPVAAREAAVAPVRDRADSLHDGPFARDAHWIRRIAALHPADPGVLVALLLRRYELQPLQALALDAGNLHAYLEGMAIEIMASSDNVLRGGLTPKHVDVEELLRILRFDAEPPTPTEATPLDAQRSVYTTHFSQFVLERHAVVGAGSRCALSSAAIVLVTQGSVALTTASASDALDRGQSAFVGADEQWLQFTGNGIAFVASVPPEAGA